MKESVFVRNNREKWQEFEKLLKIKNIDPDQLSNLYLKITDDLAYAKTYFPKSQSHKYLNYLASNVHVSIYKNKKEKRSRFITFWKYELPLVYFQHRKELLISLLVFVGAACIGLLSVLNDETFARLILSDGYVNLTIENIEKGDPLAIYKRSGSVFNFLYITKNNIQVSFTTFASGVFLSIGSVLILFLNGVMLGTFQGFFIQYDLLIESILIVWIHGTLEISAIVIAGGAGLVLGNSILFPQTYRRSESFKRGAKNGIKMAMGLVPIFIVAGFLESFVTRHTYMAWYWSALIISLSAAFVVFYFVIYPKKVANGR